MAPKNKTIMTVELIKTRETKGTWVFHEDPDDKRSPREYVKKEAWEKAGKPDKIVKTLEAA